MLTQQAMELPALWATLEALAKGFSRVLADLGFPAYVVAGITEPGQIVLHVVSWDVRPGPDALVAIAGAHLRDFLPAGWAVAVAQRRAAGAPGAPAAVGVPAAALTGTSERRLLN